MAISSQKLRAKLMKNIFYMLLGLIVSSFSNQQLNGQSAVQTVVLKKGEVLDILLLSQNPNSEADLKSYFQTAFPVAKRMSYQSVPGFKIKGHTQGNLRPSSLILGKWSDVKNREAFLSQILEEVPDFHERRRKIWSYFGLHYFEIQEDFSFEIDRNQYHVATAYWLKEQDDSSKFYKKWIKTINKMGGQILLKLQDGTSPFGYSYDPNYFVITSWENQAAFKVFKEAIQAQKMDNIKHVNEFILE